jgi:hypothetical protein
MPRINLINTAALGALAALSLGASSATAATLTRSIDVKGTPAAVWAAIGPFCAIAAWHPAIATCASDGKAKPTRTLVTKDGARFVELQTARADRSYSYSFTSSPVPVSNYSSTLSVTAKGPGVSTVTWSGSYTPNEGKAEDADAALSGIYESGLGAIKARLAK